MRGKLTICLLVACALFPKVATAQSTLDQCNWLSDRALEAAERNSFKEEVSLVRRKLGLCRQYMDRDEYGWALEELAYALNQDNQYGEALGVANQCLEIVRDFGCIVAKADALKFLGRVSEAKSLVDTALSLPAITEFDAKGKTRLQKRKVELSALTRHDMPSSPPPGLKIDTTPDNDWGPQPRAEVPLKKDRGTFVVPVQINGAITLNFTIDSGAADVTVPSDVFSTLRRTGTISDADITGEQTYVLADGSKKKSVTFTIRSLRIGDNVVENVRGSVAPAEGSLLLGQSFLEHFKSWSFDNTKHQLVLEPQ